MDEFRRDISSNTPAGSAVLSRLANSSNRMLAAGVYRVYPARALNPAASAGMVRKQMPMEMYQHDRATMFQFVLRGELAGDRIPDLEHAWHTANSILGEKELVVDLSGVTNADPSGIALLSRMRGAGVRLTAALPPESEDLLRSLGVPVAVPDGRHDDCRRWRPWRWT